MKIDFRTCDIKYHDCKIFIDGVSVSKNVVVDDQQGYVEFLKVDDKGDYIVDYDNDDVVREKIYGQVRIDLFKFN